MESRPRKQIARWVTIAALAAMAGPLTWSALAQTDPVDLEASTVRQIRQDIETFRLLYRMELTGAQADSMVAKMQPLAELQREWRRVQDAPEVRAALLAMRAAAALGQPITDDLWDRLVTAQRAVAGPQAGDDDEPMPLEDRRWELARSTANEVVAELTPAQQLTLAAPWTADVAEDVVEDMRHARAEPADEWAGWRDEWIADFVADQPERADALAEQLKAVFSEARAMTPDQFFEQRQQLADRLGQALAPQLDDEERRERAAERLTDLLLENDRFIACLEEYATNQVE